MDHIGSHVRGLVAAILCMEEGAIDDGEPLSNYGMTSVDLIDLVVKLEERFKVSFDPSTMTNLTCRLLADNIAALVPAGR